jgi:hypothetical protein
LAQRYLANGIVLVAEHSATSVSRIRGAGTSWCSLHFMLARTLA